LKHLLERSPTHSTLTIGAEPVWNPRDWPQIVARRSSLRAQLNRARNKGSVRQPVAFLGGSPVPVPTCIPAGAPKAVTHGSKPCDNSVANDFTIARHTLLEMLPLQERSFVFPNTRFRLLTHKP